MSRKTRNHRRKATRRPAHTAVAQAGPAVQPSPETQPAQPPSPTAPEHQKGYAGYDATLDKPRRSPPPTRTKAEDEQLTQGQRRKIIATANNQMRNLALLGWMVRKHVDYVSRFTFQCKSDDTDLNEKVEAFIKTASTARNFDSTGRYNRQRFASINEICRVLHGDVFTMVLRSGHVQAIESDRVTRPSYGLPAEYAKLGITKHGLVIGPSGKTRRYCICKRDGSTLRYERLVDAWNIIPLGYYWRHDARRGSSPLSAAINTLQDLYESWDYALIKAKFHAMFGIAIKSAAPGDLGFPESKEDSGVTDDESGDAEPRYKFEIQPGLKLELEQGDEVDTIESHSPSTEFKDYSELMVHIAMLALDIPFTMFDSRASSFSARIGDNLQYAKSAATKQADQRTWHNTWTRWRLILAENTGEFRLPRGMAVDDLAWEWQAGGIPVTDPVKETKADVEAVKAGFTSPQRVCKKHGMDFFEVLEEIAQARDAAEALNITLVNAWTEDEDDDDDDEDK